MLRVSLLLIIVFSKICDASSMIDVYEGSVPSPVTYDEVHYTTPAVQGAHRNRLNLQELSEMIKVDAFNKSEPNLLKLGNVYVLLHFRENHKDIEVTSIWKK